jgi:hypothetical protein
MTPQHTYITSIDFINNLTFDYVETYSFQRGQAFEENKKLIQAEYDRLKRRKEKFNNLSTAEEERFFMLHGLLGHTQYLINDKGQFHPSSKRTNVFSNNDPNIDRIKNILLTPINDIPRFMCAPEYRDALVFYGSDKTIVSILNICLSCNHMYTMFNHIDGDFETYDLLKRFFIDIGHEVEKPDYFILDDINKMKSKYNIKSL